MGKCLWKFLQCFFMSEKTAVEGGYILGQSFQYLSACFWGYSWHRAHVVFREQLGGLWFLRPPCRSQGLNSGPPGLGGFIHWFISQAHISLWGYLRAQAFLYSSVLFLQGVCYVFCHLYHILVILSLLCGFMRFFFPSLSWALDFKSIA